MFIKPREKIMLRDPVTRIAVPVAGKEVSDRDPFWLRRVRDGDAIVSEPPKAEAQ